MTPGQTIFVAVLCVLVAGLTVTLVKLLDYLRRKDAESEARRILDQAKLEADNIRREADLEIKEKDIQQRAQREAEFQKIRDELYQKERALAKREDELDAQTEQLRKQERIVETTQRKLTDRLEEVGRRKEELQKLLDMQRQVLHEVSGLSREEAAKRLMDLLEMQLQQETGALILRYEQRLQEMCREKSREILLTAIQRYAAAHTAETTTSTVDIPNDEMKGRIIGREGR
ncbi:MAG: DUF3552 domain-containing protein, partial [Thermogutta sp.]|nr:DUF3552 domain-containing protein [Thermogutta sp.]